jgi:hypothetical protein
MIDYYAILSRAIDASAAKDAAWRRNLYDRARRTLASEMRARRPPPSRAEMAHELAALEAAVERIEAESPGNASVDGGRRARSIAVTLRVALAAGGLDRGRPDCRRGRRRSLRFLVEPPAYKPGFARAAKQVGYQ